MYLIIGASGTVGSEVTKKLLQQGESVRCLVRDDAKLSQLPAGASGVIADLEQPASLTAAFKGISAVFLLNALSQSETAQGLAAIAAARAAGVEKIVYLSVPMPEGATHIPHFSSKIAVEQALMASSIDYTILRPNNFFQNDAWFLQAIMDYKIYPQPLGEVGLNRIDVRDIADAAVNALCNSGFENQSYELHGPDTLTSLSTSAAYRQHTGLDIQHAGDDLESWAVQAKTMLPEWMVEGLQIMYQYFQDHGLVASALQLKHQQQIIGHAPRSFDDYVQEVIGNWRAN